MSILRAREVRRRQKPKSDDVHEIVEPVARRVAAEGGKGVPVETAEVGHQQLKERVCDQVVSRIYCSDDGGEPPCILFPKDLTCPQGQDPCGHENNSQHPPSTSSGLSVSAYESLDSDVVCCAPDERCMAYGDQYGDTWTQCDKACTDDICQGTGDDPGPVVHGHYDPAYYNGINYMPAGKGNPDSGKCACAEGFHGIYCDAAACFNRQSDVQGGGGAAASRPAIAALAGSSRYVAVWQAVAENLEQTVSVGQVADLAGSQVDQFQVSTPYQGRQERAQVAGLAQGGFVAVWQSLHIGGSWGVHAQLFDDAGSAIGQQFPVSAEADAQRDPAVAGLAGGGFVVVWRGYAPGGPDSAVYAQLYDAAAVPVGAAIQLSTAAESETTNDAPSVCALPSGGFAAAWQTSPRQTDSGSGGAGLSAVVARACTAAGACGAGVVEVSRGAGVAVNALPRVAGLSDGAYVVVWAGASAAARAGTDIYGQEPKDFCVQAFQHLRSITSAQAITAAGAPEGAIVTAAGGLKGRPFAANTSGAAARARMAPAVVSLSAASGSYNKGAFVIAWTSLGGQDGDGAGIYGQVFRRAPDATVERVLLEFAINGDADSAGDQTDVALAALADGAFVAAYSSSSSSSGSSGGGGAVAAVRARVFRAAWGPGATAAAVCAETGAACDAAVPCCGGAAARCSGMCGRGGAAAAAAVTLDGTASSGGGGSGGGGIIKVFFRNGALTTVGIATAAGIGAAVLAAAAALVLCVRRRRRRRKHAYASAPAAGAAAAAPGGGQPPASAASAAAAGAGAADGVSAQRMSVTAIADSLGLPPPRKPGHGNVYKNLASPGQVAKLLQ
ncbi:hypothetical protein JKP88DRAFT_297446 [Tribonema minus]|uniref:Uncharacterized protein n=1 Tax=Tribonema minus TaxID=303371 RepID=A0A835ZDD3_9STRA|nr:hypothetical protein JKP88DRAFT_297446 [Tribonema minus]